MKRFHFTLQPIRTLREQKEQAAQQKYAQAVRACEDAARRLGETTRALQSGWTVLGEELARGSAATQLARVRAYCVVVEERQKADQAALDQAQQTARQVWQQLVLAMRDREVMDHFHDKQRRAYDREVQRGEQKILDDLAARLTLAVGAWSRSSPSTPDCP